MGAGGRPAARSRRARWTRRTARRARASLAAPRGPPGPGAGPLPASARTASQSSCVEGKHSACQRASDGDAREASPRGNARRDPVTARLPKGTKDLVLRRPLGVARAAHAILVPVEWATEARAVRRRARAPRRVTGHAVGGHALVVAGRTLGQPHWSAPRRRRASARGRFRPCGTRSRPRAHRRPARTGPSKALCSEDAAPRFDIELVWRIAARARRLRDQRVQGNRLPTRATLTSQLEAHARHHVMPARAGGERQRGARTSPPDR